MNDEKYMLFQINIYVRSEDIKKYSYDLVSRVEERVRRELSFYSLSYKIDITINILPVLSNKSHLELSINTIDIDTDFVSNEMFVDGMKKSLSAILPSSIDYFIFRQFEDENFVIVE